SPQNVLLIRQKNSQLDHTDKSVFSSKLHQNPNIKYTIYPISFSCVLEQLNGSIKEKVMNRTRVLLADDHVMLMDGLVQLVRQEFDVVGLARDGRALVELARQYRPDVIVTDISMPLLNGIDAARILRKEPTSSCKLLFLSMHADFPLVEEAFRAGASGYVLKL